MRQLGHSRELLSRLLTGCRRKPSVNSLQAVSLARVLYISIPYISSSVYPDIFQLAIIAPSCLFSAELL